MFHRRTSAFSLKRFPKNKCFQLIQRTRDRIWKRRKYVLTYSGDGSDYFSKLELVQDRRFTSRIKPDHQDPHLLLREEPAK